MVVCAYKYNCTSTGVLFGSVDELAFWAKSIGWANITGPDGPKETNNAIGSIERETYLPDVPKTDERET